MKLYGYDPSQSSYRAGPLPPSGRNTISSFAEEVKKTARAAAAEREKDTLELAKDDAAALRDRLTPVSKNVLDRMEAALGEERAARFHSHFSQIEFTPGGGEKCHRTFADDGGYGPSWAPLAAEIARRGWSPTFICESAGTQAEDALTMKDIYQTFAERCSLA